MGKPLTCIVADGYVGNSSFQFLERLNNCRQRDSVPDLHLAPRLIGGGGGGVSFGDSVVAAVLGESATEKRRRRDKMAYSYLIVQNQDPISAAKKEGKINRQVHGLLRDVKGKESTRSPFPGSH